MNFDLSFYRCSLPLVLLALLAAGCKREEVREYRVPKEKAAAPQTLPAGHPNISPAHHELPPAPKIQWTTLPPGWTEKTASTMRAASFAVGGKDGQTADVGVIPLPTTGNETELVNMWRQQLQLPAITAADTDKQSGSVVIGGETGKFFDMTSETPVVEGSQRMRIMVGMLPRDGTSWFFKMTGDEQFVAEQKSAFTEFLKGVSFSETSPPADAASAPAEAADSDSGLPQWTVPANWKSQPPGQMVLASFAIAGETSGKATMAVSAFPGNVGGTLANLNRWRRQIGLGEMGENEMATLVSPAETGGGPAQLADMTGAGARLLVAILPRAGQTWFFKMTGDEAVVAKEKDSFVAFLKSLKF